MDRQTEIKLIKEIIDLKKRGETQYHEEPRNVSTKRYICPDWFEKEKQKLFFANPIAIGITAEVPDCGDYQVIEAINGLSLIMVRDQNERVRVYANACRHRNARLLANGESGCKKRFSCPYHAWTYNTEGQLVGAPEFDKGFSHLDKTNLGLIEFDAKVEHGIVLVNLDRNQSLSNKSLHPEMAKGFSYLNIEGQRVYKKRSYIVKANWKILLEGGIEAYHFNVAHRHTLAPFFLGNLSTWNDMGNGNLRMILPKKPILAAKELPEEEWDLRKMANIIYNISPTMLFLAQPDNISLIKMTPLSPGETRIEEVLLVDSPKDGAEWSPEELKMHETNYHLVHKILMEDWVLGETIQANMESGVSEQVHLGRFESALIWFHDYYDDLIGVAENQTKA